MNNYSKHISKIRNNIIVTAKPAIKKITPATIATAIVKDLNGISNIETFTPDNITNYPVSSPSKKSLFSLSNNTTSISSENILNSNSSTNGTASASRHRNIYRDFLITPHIDSHNDNYDETNDLTPAEMKLINNLLRLDTWPRELSIKVGIGSNQIVFSPDGHTDSGKTLSLVKMNERFFHVDEVFYKCETPPDGNCFLHAILSGLTPGEKKVLLSKCCRSSVSNRDSEISKIRKAMSYYYFNNHEEFDNYLIESNKYINTDNIAKDGSWCGEYGDLFPHLITKIPGWPEYLSLKIYSPTNKNKPIEIKCENNARKKNRSIKLFLQENHYELLISANDPIYKKSLSSDLVFFTEGKSLLGAILANLDHEQRADLLNKASLKVTDEDEIILMKKIQQKTTLDINELLRSIYENLQQFGFSAMGSMAQSAFLNVLPFQDFTQAIMNLYNMVKHFENRDNLLGVIDMIKSSVNLGLTDEGVIKFTGDLIIKHLGKLGTFLVTDSLLNRFLSYAQIPVPHMAIFLLFYACSVHRQQAFKKSSKEDEIISSFFSYLQELLSLQANISSLFNSSTVYPFKKSNTYYTEDKSSGALSSYQNHKNRGESIKNHTGSKSYDTHENKSHAESIKNDGYRVVPQSEIAAGITAGAIVANNFNQPLRRIISVAGAVGFIGSFFYYIVYPRLTSKTGVENLGNSTEPYNGGNLNSTISHTAGLSSKEIKSDNRSSTRGLSPGNSRNSSLSTVKPDNRPSTRGLIPVNSRNSSLSTVKPDNRPSTRGLIPGNSRNNSLSTVKPDNKSSTRGLTPGNSLNNSLSSVKPDNKSSIRGLTPGNSLNNSLSSVKPDNKSSTRGLTPGNSLNSSLSTVKPDNKPSTGGLSPVNSRNSSLSTVKPVNRTSTRDLSPLNLRNSSLSTVKPDNKPSTGGLSPVNSRNSSLSTVKPVNRTSTRDLSPLNLRNSSLNTVKPVNRLSIDRNIDRNKTPALLNNTPSFSIYDVMQGDQPVGPSPNYPTEHEMSILVNEARGRLSNPYLKFTKFDNALIENMKDNKYLRRNRKALTDLIKTYKLTHVKPAEKNEIFNYESINSSLSEKLKDPKKYSRIMIPAIQYYSDFMGNYVPEDSSVFTRTYITALFNKMLEVNKDVSPPKSKKHNFTSPIVNKYMADVVMFQSIYNALKNNINSFYYSLPYKSFLFLNVDFKYILSNMYRNFKASRLQHQVQFLEGNIDEFFFSDLIDSSRFNNYIKNLTHNYLEDNSTSLKSLQTPNEAVPELGGALKQVFNDITSNMRSVINSSLPFNFYNSEIGGFIKNNSMALGALLPKLGMTLNHDSVVNDGLITVDVKEIGGKYVSRNNVTENILSPAVGPLSSIKRDNYQWEDIGNFISSLDKNKLRAVTESNYAPSSSEDNYYQQVYKNFNSHFGRELDTFLDTSSPDLKLGNDSSVPDSSRYFMRTLRALMKRNEENIDKLPQNEKDILTRTIQGNITSSELRKNKKTLTKFAYESVFLSNLEDRLHYKDFSTQALSSILNFNFTKLSNASEIYLLNSGEFDRIHTKAINTYNEYSMEFIENTLKALLEEGDSFLTFPKENTSFFISEINKIIDKKTISDADSILFAEYILAMSFMSEKIKTQDTIFTLTDRILQEFKTGMEIKKDEIYRKILSKKNATEDDIASLKRVNIMNIFFDIELQERHELIRLTKDVLDKCIKTKDGITSPLMYIENIRDNSEFDLIRQSKIAAVKHLYNVTEENEILLVNVFDASETTQSEEADTLKALSALYWLLFGHATFRKHVQPFFQYIDNPNKPLIDKNSTPEEQTAALANIRPLIALTSLTRIIRLHQIYSQKFSGRAIMLKELLSSKAEFGKYTSITDIKKRSEIEGYNLETYVQQFRDYAANNNSDKDATVILARTLLNSGVNPGMLKLPPKKIWSYKHVNRRFEEKSQPFIDLNIKGRDNDLLIIQTQDNNFLVSLGSVFLVNINYIPNLSTKSDLSNVGCFIKSMPSDEYGNVEFRYGIKDFSYQVENQEYPNYIALNLKSLDKSVFEQAQVGLYTDGNKKMLLFKKSPAAIDSSDTVANIIHKQIKDYLQESLGNIEIIYNNHEDVGGAILGFIPFGEQIRAWANGMKLTQRQIGLLVVDGLMSGLSLAGRAAYGFRQGVAGIAQNTVEKWVSSEGTKLTFEFATKLSAAVIKDVFATAKMAGFISLHEIVGLTPLPIVWHTGKYIAKKGLKNSHIIRRSRELTKGISASPEYWARAKQRAEDIMAEGIYQRLGAEFFANNDIPVPKRMEQPAGDIFEADIQRMLGEFFEEPLEIQAQPFINHFAETAARANIPGWTQAWQVDVRQFARDHFRGIRFFENNANRENGINAIGNGLNRAARNHARGRAKYISKSFPEIGGVLQRVGRTLDRAMNDPWVSNVLSTDLSNIFPLQNPRFFNGLFGRAHQRINIMHELINYYTAHPENIVFWERPNDMTFAFTYPDDARRTLFINAATPDLAVHKTIIHESSHHTGTEDFIYQTFNFGTGQLRPNGELIELLRAPQNYQQMAHANLDGYIRQLLNVDRMTPLNNVHYQAAHSIVNRPDFPETLILSNADSFTDFIEYLDRRYTIEPNGNFILKNIGRQARSLGQNVTEDNGNIHKELLKFIFTATKDSD